MTSILFLDFAGAPYDGNTVRTSPIGGSELANVQLAEALAERGHTCHILVGRDPDQTPRQINGVWYGHTKIDAKNVILSRMTPLPVGLSRLNKIVSLTDMGPHRIAECDYLVGVSRWQLDRFAAECRTAKRRVIPPIVENPPVVEKVPGRYVYASAAPKGLRATIDAWREIRPKLPDNAELRVSWSGWGEPDFVVEDPIYNIVKVGPLTPEENRKEIASAVSLFYVNVYPETFCAIAAIAEASKTVPYILAASKDGPAGLSESITAHVYYTRDSFFKAVVNGRDPMPPKNYSPNKIATSWENILT